MSRKASRPGGRQASLHAAAPTQEAVEAVPPAAPADAVSTPAPEASSSRRSPSHKSVAALLAVFWALGALNLFHPLFEGRYLGDVGDTRFNLYVLEHEYKLVTDKAYPGTFSSAPMWFPDYSENSMARSDMFTGAQPFYFLPRLFLNRDRAYHAFFLIAATLNFLAFFWLCRSVGIESALVAALAAWVFAFGMHKVQHTVHSQFYVEFWGVGCIGFLIRFLRAPARSTLFWAALFLGLQALSSPYTGVFYTLAGLLFTAVYLAVSGREAFLRVWDACRADFLGMAGAVALAAAPALALLSPYAARGGHLARPWAEIAPQLARPGFWFLPFQGTLWWFIGRAQGIPHDTYFLGAVFFLLWVGALAAFGLLRSWREDRLGRLALACAALAPLLILLGIRLTPGWGLWHVVYSSFPGAKSIRDTARIALAANLFILLAGALFLDVLARRLRGSAARALVYGCIVLALAENCVLLGLTHRQDRQYRGMYTYPANWYAAEYAEMRDLMKGAQSAYVYTDPRAQYDFAHEDNVRLASQEADVPVFNGIGIEYPPGYGIRMHPRDVLSKGMRFDFNGFRYLVPVSEEPGLREELRLAGLSRERQGTYFIAYDPYRVGGPEPKYDVDFQAIDPLPQAMQPGEEKLLRVLVTNRSSYPWQPFGEYPTLPGFREFEPDTGKLALENANDLSQVLFPQDSAVSTLHFRAPRAPGKYLVHLMVVRQKICWFKPADPAREVKFLLTVGP